MGTAGWGPRRGRRDNGLTAAEYAVAGDVDPRVGEHLLDVLAGDGIAAYLQPASDLHPVTRTTTIPARPTDRLFVDRQHVATARDYLTRLAEGDSSTSAEPSASSAGSVGSPADDEAWAQIVAGFHADAVPGPAPWPEAESLQRRTGSRRSDDEPATGPPDPDDSGDPPPFRAAVLRADEPSLLDGLDTFGAHLPDDDEGTYEPPPPPPLPRPSKAVVFAVLGIVVGFVLFIRPELAPFDPDLARLAALGAVGSGVVALILRLRPGDEDDERDPDDGAVV